MSNKIACPQCGSMDTSFYDGALGYEAVRCNSCNEETDLNNDHAHNPRPDRPRTIIGFNGSHFAGEKPDGLEVLYERLKTETLDPVFEKYGDFCYVPPAGGAPAMVRFWGNFYTYSHAFQVDTNDKEVIAKLFDLIRENQLTDAYKEAKRQRQEQDERSHQEQERRQRHWSGWRA